MALKGGVRATYRVATCPVYGPPACSDARASPSLSPSSSGSGPAGAACVCRTRAEPRSPILRTPWADKRRLAGFRSRCSTRRAWRKRTPCSSCQRKPLIWASGRRRRLRWITCSRSLGMYSSTNAKCGPWGKASKSFTTWAWPSSNRSARSSRSTARGRPSILTEWSIDSLIDVSGWIES